MKHIAMLTCLNANAVCTGASCLKAFYDRTGSFCNLSNGSIIFGCVYEMQWMWKSPNTDHGMLEKNREAQAVRNANCTCWNLRQKKRMVRNVHP